VAIPAWLIATSVALRFAMPGEVCRAMASRAKSRPARTVASGDDPALLGGLVGREIMRLKTIVAAQDLFDLSSPRR
jgi:hypothetical protein